MSLKTGTSKSKKSFRGFLRDTFGRSSRSRTTSKPSQRPISQVFFSSGAPNELHALRPTASLADIHSSANKQSTPSHTVSQSTVTAEHTDSQTTPTPSDAQLPDISEIPPSTGQAVDDSQLGSATTALDVETSEPIDSQLDSQSDPLATDASPTLDSDATPDATDPTWVSLRTSLQGLRDSSSLLLPLASAADTLLSCIGAMQAFARTRQDYTELAIEIATLGISLTQSLGTLTSTEISKCISGLAFEIKREAQEMEEKLYRGTGKEPLLAEEDGDGTTRHFRQIYSLCTRLETNFNMNSWRITNGDLVNQRLDRLKPVKDATYDSILSSTIDRRACTIGTRTEVLANLAKWAHNQEASPVYWMSGAAGTGKTTIACSFSESLERKELLAASFFYTRAAADCRDVTRMIPTIAFQLAHYSVPFQSALYEVLEKEPGVGSSKNMQQQFEHLLRDPLIKAKDSLPDHLVVVIDALDESNDRHQMELMFDTLSRNAPTLPLKFFITSRPEPDIYDRMSQSQSREAIHLHDIEQSTVQQDIELYLKSELTTISPSSAEIKQLVQFSGVLFIYAATLVRFIRAGKRLAEPYKRLRSVLSTTSGTTGQRTPIDTLYTIVLKLALNEDELEADKVEDMRMVMRTVLLAQDPISVETIATLAGIDDPKRVRLVLQPLKPVLHLSEETDLVSVLHPSFPDFMFDHERSGAYFFDTLEHNRILAERCFLVMREQLRFNICNLESSFVTDDKVYNIRKRIQQGISPALTYGCRHWVSHLALSSKSDDLLAMLEDFVQRQLLFWMEVLNLKREITAGVEGLLRVKQWLIQAEVKSLNLATLVEDAFNFVTNFASSPVSQSTPHIYISSLPFCSRSSSVFKHYRQKTRGLLELQGSLMTHRETAALAIWNIGSEVNSVAYSPDGTRIIVGCEEGPVTMLDAHDGTHLLSLSQSNSQGANSVAFSPDGKSVASGHGGKDCSVQVWDAYNGTLISRPHNCDHDIHSVAFSPDGVRLAFGSFGKDVYVWNKHDRSLFQSPINHFYHVFSVAFSPDGTLIASSSSISTKGTIHLWNSQDGTSTTPPLQGHTGHVTSVTFTPDGSRLVSGSEDKTIRVWNVSDGSPIGSPFKGHTQAVRSVAVSPDGTRVASGSSDRTVRVWNIDDGTLVAGPFIGHTARVCSVAYSPDGTRIISGSSDQTIRVWIIHDGLLSSPTPFKRHISSLKSISSIGNGTQVLSASEDSSFWVWDMPTCKAAINFPQRKRLSSLRFSPPTGSNIARDQGRQLDTIDSRPLAWSSKGHKDPLTSSAVSGDSTLLVTGFGNGAIRVWDLQTMELVAGPFQGHGGEVTSLLLSPDHSHVISCSREDTTIRVWNARNTMLDIPPSADIQIDSSHSANNPQVFDGWSLQEDGWVTNSSSQLLLWIPPDLGSSHIWPSPHAELMITKDGMLHIPRQELLLGDQWTQCYLAD